MSYLLAMPGWIEMIMLLLVAFVLIGSLVGFFKLRSRR